MDADTGFEFKGAVVFQVQRVEAGTFKFKVIPKKIR